MKCGLWGPFDQHVTGHAKVLRAFASSEVESACSFCFNLSGTT